jgi:hypothetical protein
VRAGQRKEATDLGSAPSGIFFAVQLDDPNQLEKLHEIDFYAQAIFAHRKGLKTPAKSARVPICPSGKPRSLSDSDMRDNQLTADVTCSRLCFAISTDRRRRTNVIGAPNLNQVGF